LSSLPEDQLTKVQQFPDNGLLRFLLSDPVMHWGVFAVLSGLLCFGFYRSLYSPRYIHTSLRGRRKLLTGQAVTSNQLPAIKVILLGIGYVLFIEIYQTILPWRDFGVNDIRWGSVGVVSTAVLAKNF